jgi:hypothetical protein
MSKAWLLALFVFMLGCSGGVPDKQAALEMINHRYAVLAQFLSLDIGRTGTECYFLGDGSTVDVGYRPETDIETIVAVKAGYVVVKSAEKDRWDISLTDKGNAIISAEHRKPFYHRVGNGCDEYQIAFPIARAHASDVAGPKAEAGTYEYTYSWKWEVTQLGVALRQDGDVYPKLTSSQKNDLQELAKVPRGLNDGPVLPIPVPSEANNPPRPGTGIFQKENDRWVFNVRQ